MRSLNRYASVAQLDRVNGYEPLGRGFESLRAYHKLQYPNLGSDIFLFFYKKQYFLQKSIDKIRKKSYYILNKRKERKQNKRTYEREVQTTRNLT